MLLTGFEDGRLAAAAVWIFAIHNAYASPSPPSHMNVGGNALAPIALVDFCLRKPRRCADSRDIQQVTLDHDRLEQLAFFQRGVNHLITPMSQRPDAPWQDDAAVGDCKEYVLAKRDRLLDAGWPASALLFAIATLANGAGHLVLVVVTDQGDLVLDNLQDHVVRWDSLPYTWLKRSSPANPLYWQTIVPGREPSEAATIHGASRSRSEPVSWHPPAGRQD